MAPMWPVPPYRHFPSGNDLLAAAFRSLIPPAPTAPEEGTLRERLVSLVLAQAELIAEAPATLTAMYWLALGGDLEKLPTTRGTRADSAEVATLRERVAQQYAEPFNAIFDSPQAAGELADVDRTMAIALLLGPVLVGRISTVAAFDYRECANAAVDGFLAVYGKVRTPRSGQRIADRQVFQTADEYGGAELGFAGQFDRIQPEQ